MCIFNTRLKNLQQEGKTRSTYFINVGYRDFTVGIHINFFKYSVKETCNEYLYVKSCGKLVKVSVFALALLLGGGMTLLKASTMILYRIRHTGKVCRREEGEAMTSG